MSSAAGGPASAGVTRRASPRLLVYVVLVAGGVLCAVALRAPALLAVVAPFALAVFVDAAHGASGRLTAALDVEPTRTLEGESVRVTGTVATARRRTIELVLPVSSPALTRHPARVLAVGGERDVDWELAAVHWGAVTVGPLLARSRSPLGLFTETRELGAREDVRVYPAWSRLRRLVRPAETQPYAGNQPARRAGEGIEFADLRPFASGDRVRDVNWKETARRREPWVTVRHPERNADVVLLLDEYDPDVLDDVVRGAATLARSHLGDRDRVGLVSLGGVLRWYEPGLGERHGYRLLDTLIEAQVLASATFRRLSLLPARILPPQALVVALSSLKDERIVLTLQNLRGRGRDVAAVQIVHEPPPADSPEGELALRLWQLRRATGKERLLRAGIAVSTWDPGEPLALPIEEVWRWRRFARAGSA